MNRWDEGSWGTDPQRHGRITIIVDRGKWPSQAGRLASYTSQQLFCTRYGRCSSSTDSVLRCINFGQACIFNTFGLDTRGGREDILANVEKYRIEKILFAIPSASPEIRRDILNICKETSCELKSLPGVYELANGDTVAASEMRDVNVVDLLGRDPIQVDLDEIFEYLSGKVILVTGGGGSIGSELCRQIADHNPKQLIILALSQ